VSKRKALSASRELGLPEKGGRFSVNLGWSSEIDDAWNLLPGLAGGGGRTGLFLGGKKK